MRKFLFWLLLLFVFTQYKKGRIDPPVSSSLYFPPMGTSSWQTVSPALLGWNETELANLFSFLEQKGTKAFIILKNGHMAVEQYFGNFTADSTWYWASAGKTMTAFLVSQNVEAFNSGRWKATIIEVGSGKMAGYIKVHDDDSSSTSDQYLKASSIREVKTKATENYAVGPRNGRYSIRSYGGKINNTIILGYFDLNKGTYKYYDAVKKLIGSGIYTYNASSKQVTR